MSSVARITKFILPAKDRFGHLVVSRETHEAIKAFASANNTTITQATQYLLMKALENEYSKE